MYTRSNVFWFLIQAEEAQRKLKRQNGEDSGKLFLHLKIIGKLYPDWWSVCVCCSIASASAASILPTVCQLSEHSAMRRAARHAGSCATVGCGAQWRTLVWVHAAKGKCLFCYNDMMQCSKFSNLDLFMMSWLISINCTKLSMCCCRCCNW